MPPTPLHRFNTQPPEGGWRCRMYGGKTGMGFNTQPPEGGWMLKERPLISNASLFQHAAARRRLGLGCFCKSNQTRFQHAAARRRLVMRPELVCTLAMFQHAAARRRLETSCPSSARRWKFQHAAARRRLVALAAPPYFIDVVSTRSRPKAAGSWPIFRT